MKWTIRQEREGDEAAIAGVIRAAFAGTPHADGDEADLPGKLREAGALVLSLVAVARGEVIGHVALSPARVGAGRFLCLGPLAVRPKHQGKGIGSALVGHALGVAQVYGRDGVVVMGDPGFYGRFGFERVAGVTYDGPGADVIQVLPFGEAPAGAVQFHPAFG